MSAGVRQHGYYVLMVMRNGFKARMVRAVAILFAMEILIFLLGAVAGFAIGVSDSGIQQGFGMASGVLYNWFGFAVLGIVAWVVVMVALAFRKKDKPLKNGA